MLNFCNFNVCLLKKYLFLAYFVLRLLHLYDYCIIYLYFTYLFIFLVYIISPFYVNKRNLFNQNCSEDNSGI